MKTGLLFPGQGSQFVGMVDAWLGHPAAKAVIEEANAAFGRDLAELGQDEEALKRTDVVQPVTLACELACYAVLQEAGVELAAAGVITTQGALDTVRVRAQAMQAAADQGGGAMTAVVGLSPDDAAAICAEAAQGEVLLVANENSPVQTVVSGTAAAIERVEAIAKERKVRAIRLPLPGAFHSPLMEPARQEVESAIDKLDFRPPRFPVIPNALGTPVTDPGELQAALRRHLVSPVHWIATMNAMKDLGVTRVVEAGPGKVLTGLAKRCTPDIEAVPANTPEEAAAL
jgi:[acyl-carrier-protein] S-malonyltransferase